MKVKFEPASSDYISRIVDLKLDMFREFGYDKYLAKNAREIIVEDYTRMYEENLAIHFLAKVDNDVIGMAGAFIKSDIPYRYFVNSQYGFIGDVYTLPDYRNLGISMKLNEEALSWLKDYGVSCVRLLASDAGRSIYERLGFYSDVSMILNFEPYD